MAQSEDGDGQLNQQDVAALKQMAEWWREQGELGKDNASVGRTTRRKFMGLLAGAGLGAASVGGYATGQATAGTESAGIIGTEANPADAYVEDFYDHNGNQPMSFPGGGAVSIGQVNNIYTASTGGEVAEAVNTDMSSGDLLILDAGTNESLTIPEKLDFPVHTTTLSATRGTISLEKGFNGTLATLYHGTTFIGVRFDGNKSSYTGDLVVDRQDARGCRFVRCHFRNAAGDGRIEDGWNNVYSQCIFGNNDGWDRRVIDSVGTHPSSNYILHGTEMQGDGLGCNYYDDCGRAPKETFQLVVDSPAGPVIRAEMGERTEGWSIEGNIVLGDGPLLLVDSSSSGGVTRLNGVTVDGQILGMNQNPGSAGVTDAANRDVGTIHLQGSALIDGINITGYVDGDNTDEVVVSDYSDLSAGVAAEVHARVRNYSVGLCQLGGQGATSHLKDHNNNAYGNNPSTANLNSASAHAAQWDPANASFTQL